MVIREINNKNGKNPGTLYTELVPLCTLDIGLQINIIKYYYLQQ